MKLYLISLSQWATIYVFTLLILIGIGLIWVLHYLRDDNVTDMNILDALQILNDTHHKNATWIIMESDDGKFLQGINDTCELTTLNEAEAIAEASQVSSVLN